MFKAAIWRNEKNKIKVTFKLQFQATQVPQLGRDTMMISVVPVEVGKPTVKLEKVLVHEGSCCWENAIYETVKFNREPKSGKVNEKIYKFIASNASSKASFLGEASIDLADYIETIKPLTVSLPLKASNSGAILHVTIQRIQEALDHRDVEENEDVTPRSKERSLWSHFSTEKNGNSDSKDNEIRHRSTNENVESDGYLLAQKVPDATSASSSESSSERNTPRGLVLNDDNAENGAMVLKPHNHVSTPLKTAAKAFALTYMEHQRSNTEWSEDSVPDESTDELPSSSDDSLVKERSPLVSDASVEKLKSEIVALTRQADMSELELQTLRKQIVKESKRGQDLLREVLTLKEERNALKKECDQFKRADRSKISNKMHFENGDKRALLEEIRQELDHEKELNVNLRVQLQKTQESNSELILAVQDLEEMLEQKNKETSSLPGKHVVSTATEELEEAVPTLETDDDNDDEDQRALERIVKEHGQAKEAYLLEQKILDLYSEIDVYRRDRDELEMQMEQLALDYEILKQENHDIMSKLEQNNLQEQLKMQYLCSASVAGGNELETQVETLQNDLKKKNDEFSASLATIDELETRISCLENDLAKRNEELSASLDTIHEIETEVDILEQALKKRDEEFLTSSNTIHELKAQVGVLEEDLKKRNEEVSSSSDTIRELETQVDILEKDMKKQDDEFAASLNTIHELEMQVDGLEKGLKNKSEELTAALSSIHELENQMVNLEKELEGQEQRFEADLNAVMHAKVEQEKRAIQAEEALRKIKLNNAGTAERLQEEFRRLSVQMASAFDANEKLAFKVVSESNELRSQKSHLEELLNKANEELEYVKEHELKLKELSGQMEQPKHQEAQISFEIESMLKKLEQQKINEEEMRLAFSKEIRMLKAEVERITKENDRLSMDVEQDDKLRVEMENMKALIDETEMLVLRGHVERDELERKIDSARKEVDNSMEELNNMRHLKDEKEKMVTSLQSEVEALRTQYDNLKNALLEGELEKENLKKQVFNLKGEVQKKGDTITAIEKKLKDSNGRAALPDGNKPTSRNINKSAPPPRGSKEAASLREKIKLLEVQIKQKEAALEKSNNSFLEKEKDLLHKIEELENRMAEINQCGTRYCEDQLKKEEFKDANAMHAASEPRGDDKAENMLETRTGTVERLSIPNVVESTQNISEKEKNALIVTPNGIDEEQDDELQIEMALLREKNKLMEGELKDMQERYSEISVKFAEVEGERQKLVMAVRNLRNAIKS
ncbi:hypothetical protein Sjap_020563 [Stephania japonica]|uniref:C2 NT-type domain-containing protein n=1 Tax=Stephania japonica TaxID=461633 RepID=A0AAP0F1M3_9MAGN